MKAGLPSFSKLAAAPKMILIVAYWYSICSFGDFCCTKIGVASVVLACLCGQVVLSMILDHFMLGMPKHCINFKRVVGALLVISGLSNKLSS